MDKMKVVIADSQVISREGIASILNSKNCYEVSSIVETKQELFDVLLKVSPSILIIDPDQLKDFSHTHVRELVAIYPMLNILVLTNYTNKDSVLQVLSSGIKHFILKTCTLDEFLTALCAIVHDEDCLIIPVKVHK